MELDELTRKGTVSKIKEMVLFLTANTVAFGISNKEREGWLFRVAENNGRRAYWEENLKLLGRFITVLFVGIVRRSNMLVGYRLLTSNMSMRSNSRKGCENMVWRIIFILKGGFASVALKKDIQRQ